jgi:hypothetical protein
LEVNGNNNSLIKIIQSENNFGVYRNMEKQKFDRMKTILGILMLVFAVVPLITVSASATSGSGDRGYVGHGSGGGGGGHGDDGHGGHGGHGGYGGYGGFDGGFGGGWGGPGFGFYPPAPYGMSGDSDVICGPYGCAWNAALNYLPQAVIAEQGW